MVSTDEILKKYGRKIESELGEYKAGASKEYVKFREEMVPEISSYEKWAKSLGNILSLKLSQKETARLQKYIEIAHLDITPSQSATLAISAMLIVLFCSTGLAIALSFFTGSAQVILGFLGLVSSAFVFYYVYGMPQRIANSWRLKASSQMVPAILYIVVYMKHTSNLERAIEFASRHLEGPLALDLKKVFYNVEIGKFSTIKQAMDYYLESWRDYAPEFIESFHLIESSLFEPSESRRVIVLEKSLQVILDGVYEKMIKYTHEVRSPLTNVYMLGIILPTLGLALIPLAATLLEGAITWQHVMVLFNVIIPFAVFYLTSEALLKRPGGYGETSVLELSPNYYRFKSKKPWLVAALIAIPLLIIGFLPFLFQISSLTNALGLQSDYTFEQIGVSFLGNAKIFDFKQVGDSTVGPFGPLAVILSLFIPLAIALFFSIAYKMKSSSLMKAREDTKILEKEFASSLFQLGNRIGDGLPAEIAFGKVAESTTGQKTHDFFSLVNQNIQQRGVALDRAIFDPRIGAIISFPSALIATSMRILVESVKKGLKVAAESLMSISEYLKNIDKVNQRLHDLLAEIVSDMKSNMTFLAPLLSGIIVGLSLMITVILNKLSSFDINSLSTMNSFIKNIPTIFNIEQTIPPYFIQAIIGIYIIEIIFILTGALVTIDSGKDALQEKYKLAKNLKQGIFLYVITALLAMIALIVLTSIALANLG